MCVGRNTQITQNNKFAISLQYLEKEASDEIDFLDVNKYESFLQVDFNTFLVSICYKVILSWSSIQKVLKVTSLQYFYNISKKKLVMEFIFCMQINIKVSTSLQYRFWWKCPDMFKVPN